MNSMTPDAILDQLLAKVATDLTKPIPLPAQIAKGLDFVCRCPNNRAGVRLLMSCLLAKLHKPTIDPRKPYTEIGSADSFSGRVYDERYITHFINANRLPCNTTTAFLTPALRNITHPLTTDLQIAGTPKELYTYTLQLLDDVAKSRVKADDLLKETIRILILMREDKNARMKSLLATLQTQDETLPLSAEAIVTLAQQHLACKNSSRLPVLIVAAAYRAAASRLGEEARPLMSHNAADLQTGALGDVEVFLINTDKIVTIYEMKMKLVTADDIDQAVQKIARSKLRIDNYIFITTDTIDQRVQEYAASFYEQTATEFVILDCLGFLRHFLHLFHRFRKEFLDAYQSLVLAEPDSAVSQPLKEALLALRQAAQAQ